MSTIVKSPYNFVPAPAEKDVFKPDWADQVSHDKPFSDGESGELTLKITAETPIFIRNGHIKGTEDNEFSHVVVEGKKKYFIPATSLKGMFRNVLEIMSFSKLNKTLVNDDRYAFRDLTNGSLYLKSYRSSEVKGGWLRANENGEWVIEECTQLGLIHHEDVDGLLGTNFRQTFLRTNPEHKTAKWKYQQCGTHPLTHRFDCEQGANNKLIARPNYDGQLGTIVFTGQASKRKEQEGKRPSGKVHEFVFFRSDTPNRVPIPEKMQKDFLFIYNDHDRNNISEDWIYWKERLMQNQAIPVFYTKGGNAGIKHFGLAYMYKLPFENSIHEMGPINKYSSDRDLAELMFGYTDKSASLKGRVMISHAFSENAEAMRDLQSEILAGPKASYFPFYVEQFKNSGTREHNTYQDNTSIRGYKRYPTQRTTHRGSYTREQAANANVFSNFIPINNGATFTCKIRFHNLRKSEIGALISAITFHNNENQCFHSLGVAKSYGYGKVRVSIEGQRFLEHSKEEYLASFEEQMGRGWVQSESLESLLSMAKNNTNLEYPTIEGTNEFNQYKTDKLRLEPFPSTVRIESILKKKELEEKQKEEEFQRQEYLQRKAEEKQAFDVASQTSDLEVVLEFLRRYPAHESIQDIRDLEIALRNKIKEEEANALASESLQFEKHDFSSIKSKLNPYLKNKKFEFSEEQKKEIYDALVRSHTLEAANRKSDWNKGKYPKYPWSDIIKWLGEDLTKKLNDELN